MKAEQLRKSILQMAIQGKLVPQDPNDESASVLLEKIRTEKQKLIKEGKIKKDKFDSFIFKGDDNRYYEKIGNELKDITDEIDFELSDGWEYVRLSTICWLNDVKSTSGEKLPYLDAKTLRGKSEKNYIISGKIVESGTKVILVDGENSGEVFDVPFRGYMGSTFKILGASSNINIDYLNIVLDFYREIFKGNKIGAAIPHLNKTLFKSLLIGLPPIGEQSRIVSKLIEYTPLIMKYDKLEQEKSKLDGAIYDKLKKSILQYAVQGKLVPQDENDEPASELLKRIRTEKKAQLGKKYVDSYIYKGDDNCYYEKIGNNEPILLENLPFEIPDSWIWARLDNAVIINPRNNIDDNKEVSFVEMKSIQEGFRNSFIYESRQWKSVKSGFTHFQNNDVGFAKITPCFQNRKSCVFQNLKNGYGAGTTELHILRAYSDTIMPDYLLWFVKTPYFIEYGKKKFSGTAGQQRFGTDELKNTLIPIPPQKEQVKIIEFIRCLLKTLKKDEA